jgi:hypothetical protein
VGNVVVDQLAVRPADGLVVAATHGKGVYSISIPVGTGVDDAEIPRPSRLSQNVPNPFNPMTTISFSLTEPGHTTLTIYDLSGKRVKTLLNRETRAGEHQVAWRGTDDAERPVSAGIYLYELVSGSVREVKRMTLVR